MSKVTDKIQDVRTIFGDNEAGITKEGLEQSRTAIVGIHEARLADMGNDYIDELNDYLKNEKGRSYTVDTHTPTAQDGTTYTDVNHDKTSASHSEFAQDYKDFQTWLGNQPRKGQARTAVVKRHWDAIQGVEKFENRVWGGPHC